MKNIILILLLLTPSVCHADFGIPGDRNISGQFVRTNKSNNFTKYQSVNIGQAYQKALAPIHIVMNGSTNSANPMNSESFLIDNPQAPSHFGIYQSTSGNSIIAISGNLTLYGQTYANRGTITLGSPLFGITSTGQLSSGSSNSQFIVNTVGNIIQYNSIATTGNGVASEYATVDLTAQAASISATTLYTPAASITFRISAVLQVTQAATVSSILGGTTGIVITYTEPDGSVAQSVIMALNSQSGTQLTPASGNTGNTTTTQSNGDMIIRAKSGTAIQYAIGYTSSGATPMQYAVHLKCEAI